MYHLVCANCTCFIGLRFVAIDDAEKRILPVSSEVRLQAVLAGPLAALDERETARVFLGGSAVGVREAFATSADQQPPAKASRAERVQLRRQQRRISHPAQKRRQTAAHGQERLVPRADQDRNPQARYCSLTSAGNVLLVVADDNRELLDSERSDSKWPELSFYDRLYDQSVISTLAHKGNQPFAELLSKQFRLMFLDRKDKELQRAHLVNFLHR